MYLEVSAFLVVLNGPVGNIPQIAGISWVLLLG